MSVKRLRLSAWTWIWPARPVPPQALAPRRTSQPSIARETPARTLGARAQLWLALLVVLLASYGTWKAGSWMIAEWQWR